MGTTKRLARLLLLVIVGSMVSGVLPQAQAQRRSLQVVDIYRQGPRPQQIVVSAGTPIVWVSHMTTKQGVVCSVVFPTGEQLAEKTATVKGINGFVREKREFVGRMQGNGGEVGLQFLAPGAYTYTIDHSNLKGNIVVR